MNHIKFKKVVTEQIKRSEDLLIAKGKEYDNDPGDRLHSFKVAAALTGKTQVQALAGMLAKHTVSIYEMIEAGSKDLEKWNEKITDHINYLLILRAMLEEELANE